MLRRLFVLMVVVALLAVFVPMTSRAQEPEPEPAVVFLFDGQDEYTSTNGMVVFYTAWIVCRAQGLVTAFQNAYAVTIVTGDGDVLVDGTVKDTKQYWGPLQTAPPGVFEGCHNHEDEAHGAEWIFVVGPLEEGDYVFDVTVVQKHQVTDLFDAVIFMPDGTIVMPDGKPDKYPADEFGFTTTVHVVSAP